MKQFEKMKNFHVMDVVCDVCGKSCRNDYTVEYASVVAVLNDDEQDDVDLCKDCLKKTFDYLKSISIKGDILCLKNLKKEPV